MRKLAISVSGGGALGIGPLAFMCRLEEDIGKSLAVVGQAFAGTSTGSIIAGALDEGMSAHDIHKLYKDNLSKIFTKYPWYKRCTPKCPTYDNTNLKKLLKANFKGKVSEWKKPIYIPTTYMNGESVEKVWDLGDSVDKDFAILTSTAAPTYFDIVVKDGKSFADGGLWRNNSVDILNAGLKHSGWKRDSYKILSFNTGMDTPNTAYGNMTLIGWGEYLLGDWIAYSGKSGEYEVKADIGDENLFRASPKSEKKFKMDDVSENTLSKVEKIWTDYYASVRPKILNFMNKI